MPPRATELTLACAILALSAGAHALGVGRLPSELVLGQPLHLMVPVRLEIGESLEPGCVSAQVMAGESRWPPEAVRVRLEPAAGTPGAQPAVAAQGPGTWLIHLSSGQVVDEPVVEITLSVGCESRLARRFTAFADPPGMLAATPLLPGEAPSVAPSVAPSPRQAPLTARPMAAADDAPVRMPARSRPRAQETTPRAAVPVRGPRPAPAAPPAVDANGPQGAGRAAAAVTTRPATVAGGRLLLEVAPPRLKLDIEDPVFIPAAPAAPDAASQTADAGAGAVSDAQRLQVLEKTLAQLQREGRGDARAQPPRRARLEAAEGRGRALPWLATALVLSLGVAGWLAWRLRRAPRQAGSEPAWWDDGRPRRRAADEADPFEPLAPEPSRLDDRYDHDERDERDDPVPGEAWRLDPPPSLPATIPQSLREPPPPAEQTVVEPARPVAPPPVLQAAVADSPAEPPAVREVSVEELLDLEQQADFFIALGQEDAAIDLLMSHLRGSGGMSPLPYTKLLEIYHRQRDPEGYERIRARFNQRFNAYAPDWDQGPLGGRVLEDYAEVVARLQQCWHDPVEAMALLEALLFRREGSGELFDLPAYRDVLLLYALARDVAQHDGVELAPVDVLLPLAGASG